MAVPTRFHVGEAYIGSLNWHSEEGEFVSKQIWEKETPQPVGSVVTDLVSKDTHFPRLDRWKPPSSRRGASLRNRLWQAIWFR